MNTAERNEQNEKIETHLAALGLSADLAFIPSKVSGRKEQIAWGGRIVRAGSSAVLDVPCYSQGIAHHPDWGQGWYYAKQTPEIRARKAACMKSCDTGMRHKVIGSYRADRWYTEEKGPRLDPPPLRDILYSILSDTDGILDRTFTSWCGDFGMDEDSIKALTVFNACQREAADLAWMFTPNELNALRELFQDY